jgi:hypothetical protein
MPREIIRDITEGSGKERKYEDTKHYDHHTGRQIGSGVGWTARRGGTSTGPTRLTVGHAEVTSETKHDESTCRMLRGAVVAAMETAHFAARAVLETGGNLVCTHGGAGT